MSGRNKRYLIYLKLSAAEKEPEAVKLKEFSEIEATPSVCDLSLLAEKHAL